jgi:hypothetical protein
LRILLALKTVTIAPFTGCPADVVTTPSRVAALTETVGPRMLRQMLNAVAVVAFPNISGTPTAHAG